MLALSQGLLETLQVPQSLGFLGGRPNHAIFYIGAQGTDTAVSPYFPRIIATDRLSGWPWCLLFVVVSCWRRFALHASMKVVSNLEVSCGASIQHVAHNKPGAPSALDIGIRLQLALSRSHS